MVSAPTQIPLIALMPIAAVRLNAQDSLARSVYVKNKIWSIIKISIQEKTGQVDTLEYTELDRRGNKIVVYNPSFKARIQRQYDAKNRLIEVVQLPHQHYPYELREVMDPVRNSYTAYHDLSDAPNHLYRSALYRRHGDTLVGTAELYQMKGQPGQMLKRIMTRAYTSSPDTSRIDVFGFDEAGTVLAYQSMYAIIQNKQTIENGMLSFRQSLQALLDTSAKARQWRSQGLSDAAILARQTGLKATYLPTNHSQYDKGGRLIRSENTTPNELLEKPITRKNASSTVTNTSASYSCFTYQYNKQGRITREDFTATFPALSPTSEKTQDIVEIVKESNYSPKGLLLSETSKSAGRTTRYEYLYTRF